MGRRHLPRISPQWDTSRFCLDAATLPRPWDAAVVFGGEAAQSPLELEIGSGKGMFLAKAAARHLERLFLGVEMGRKYATFAAAALARDACVNARIVCGDAAMILRDILPAASLAAVHIYFPDPWWKRAHRKRRIIRDDVVRLIEDRLQLGGRLHFWTDVLEYFESGQQTITTNTSLVSLGDITITAAHASDESDDVDYQTHFERRTLLHRQTVYRIAFEKLVER